MIQAWIEDERLYIQTELCETSLEKQLDKGLHMEISGVYAFLRQTLLGLAILHQHNMVHLDIKVRSVQRLLRVEGCFKCVPVLSLLPKQGPPMNIVETRLILML